MEQHGEITASYFRHHHSFQCRNRVRPCGTCAHTATYALSSGSYPCCFALYPWDGVYTGLCVITGALDALYGSHGKANSQHGCLSSLQTEDETVVIQTGPNTPRRIKRPKYLGAIPNTMRSEKSKHCSLITGQYTQTRQDLVRQTRCGPKRNVQHRSP